MNRRAHLEKGTVEEMQLLMLINCCLRYDLSQERAVKVMLREDSRKESE